MKLQQNHVIIISFNLSFSLLIVLLSLIRKNENHKANQLHLLILHPQCQQDMKACEAIFS